LEITQFGDPRVHILSNETEMVVIYELKIESIPMTEMLKDCQLVS